MKARTISIKEEKRYLPAVIFLFLTFTTIVQVSDIKGEMLWNGMNAIT